MKQHRTPNSGLYNIYSLQKNLTQLKSALCSTTFPLKSWKCIISEMGLCKKTPLFLKILHCVRWFLYMRIQKIWLSTFRVWLWGQELLALNMPCEVLRQVKYFWRKYQKISLLSHALGFPVGLSLCDLLSRSAHLHWGFPKPGQPCHAFNPLLHTHSPPALQALTEGSGRETLQILLYLQRWGGLAAVVLSWEGRSIAYRRKECGGVSLLLDLLEVS